jgi:hypothetical protein
VQVRREHLHAVPPPKPPAVRAFVDAVLALSDDPAPGNVERYLIASRALDDARSTTARAA